MATRRQAVLLLVALLLTALATIAVSQARGSMQLRAVNLVATKPVKRQLRAAFLRAHPRYTSRQVRGPLRKTTYYGRYGRVYYAFASFFLPKFGTQDQPEIFKRRVGGRWRDVGDTGGEICKNVIPLALIRVWHLKRGSPGCFVPATR